MIRIIIVVALMATLATSMQDYCSESLCDGAKHIACNNKGLFAPECPSNAVAIEFTAKLIDLTLKTHNQYRDQIANGKLKRYEQAARMATLVWDKELMKLAEYNVKRCVFAHDECRNTGIYKYAGQNLGQMKSSAKYSTPENAIKTVIKGWFDEHNDANMTFIEKFRHSEKMTGHFTQLVRDEAYAVGCAMAQFKNGRWFTTLFACDYTLTNIQDNPIYEKSSKTASKCKTGVNKEYRGLCSTKEIYKNELFYD